MIFGLWLPYYHAASCAGMSPHDCRTSKNSPHSAISSQQLYSIADRSAASPSLLFHGSHFSFAEATSSARQFRPRYAASLCLIRDFDFIARPPRAFEAYLPFATSCLNYRRSSLCYYDAVSAIIGMIRHFSRASNQYCFSYPILHFAGRRARHSRHGEPLIVSERASAFSTLRHLLPRHVYRICAFIPRKL